MSTALFLPDVESTLALGRDLVERFIAGDLIFLQGELGAGKTTLVRGLLNAMGIEGPIKSPTFSLVESYQVAQLLVFHFDFYRLERPEALWDIGIDDYFTRDALCLIEWPEKAGHYLPKPSCRCSMRVSSDGQGRWVAIE